MPELNLPTPGVTPGTGWAFQVNAAFNTLNNAVENVVEDHHLATALKCVHREGGTWVWDGPGASASTHYVIPDHTGAYVVRPTPFPTPLATPAFDW